MGMSGRLTCDGKSSLGDGRRRTGIGALYVCRTIRSERGRRFPPPFPAL
jgi:hypothetical protein